MISSAKAAGGGAVRKMLPQSAGADGGSVETSLSGSELDRMERKFADLKTSLVGKCQSSKS